MIKPSCCIAVDCTVFVYIPVAQRFWYKWRQKSVFWFVLLYFETESNFVSEASLEFTIVLVDLKLTMILFSQPPGCWDYMYVPPHLAEIYLKAKMIGLLFIFKSVAIFILALITYKFFSWFYFAVINLLGEERHFQNVFRNWFLMPILNSGQ